MNHQTFERILRFRDMPGGMRDGVLVPHITPGRESWWWSLRLDESAYICGLVVAPSAALVAPSLPVRLRRGTRLFLKAFHPAEVRRLNEAAERFVFLYGRHRQLLLYGDASTFGPPLRKKTR